MKDQTRVHNKNLPEHMKKLRQTKNHSMRTLASIIGTSLRQRSELLLLLGWILLTSTLIYFDDQTGLSEFRRFYQPPP
jgi:hypothetical protein